MFKATSPMLRSGSHGMLGLGTVIDVGANDGRAFAIPAWALGYKTWAFEPIPDTFDNLHSKARAASHTNTSSGIFPLRAQQALGSVARQHLAAGARGASSGLFAVQAAASDTNAPVTMYVRSGTSRTKRWDSKVASLGSGNVHCKMPPPPCMEQRSQRYRTPKCAKSREKLAACKVQPILTASVAIAKAPLTIWLVATTSVAAAQVDVPHRRLQVRVMTMAKKRCVV